MPGLQPPCPHVSPVSATRNNWAFDKPIFTTSNQPDPSSARHHRRSVWRYYRRHKWERQSCTILSPVSVICIRVFHDWCEFDCSGEREISSKTAESISGWAGWSAAAIDIQNPASDELSASCQSFWTQPITARRWRNGLLAYHFPVKLFSSIGLLLSCAR